MANTRIRRALVALSAALASLAGMVLTAPSAQAYTTHSRAVSCYGERGGQAIVTVYWRESAWNSTNVTITRIAITRPYRDPFRAIEWGDVKVKTPDAHIFYAQRFENAHAPWPTAVWAMNVAWTKPRRSYVWADMELTTSIWTEPTSHCGAVAVRAG